MLIRSLSITIVAVLLSTTLLASDSSAQWRGARQIGQRGLRVMGHGYSAGYHWKNPGHDSSYYNPYSAHNSNLVTQPWRNQGHLYEGFDPSYGIPHFEYVPASPHEVHDIAPVSNGIQAAPVQKKDDESALEIQSEKNDSSSDRSSFFPSNRRSATSNDFIPAGFSRPTPTDDDELQLNNPFADPIDL